MTIKEMNQDRELDKAIAKYMGWKWSDIGVFSPVENGYIKYNSHEKFNSTDPLWWLPHYSDDANEALLVVDKLASHHKIYLKIEKLDKGWRISDCDWRYIDENNLAYGI